MHRAYPHTFFSQFIQFQRLVEQILFPRKSRRFKRFCRLKRLLCVLRFFSEEANPCLLCLVSSIQSSFPSAQIRCCLRSSTVGRKFFGQFGLVISVQCQCCFFHFPLNLFAGRFPAPSVYVFSVSAWGNVTVSPCTIAVSSTICSFCPLCSSSCFRRMPAHFLAMVVLEEETEVRRCG